MLACEFQTTEKYKLVRYEKMQINYVYYLLSFLLSFLLSPASGNRRFHLPQPGEATAICK